MSRNFKARVLVAATAAAGLLTGPLGSAIAQTPQALAPTTPLTAGDPVKTSKNYCMDTGNPRALEPLGDRPGHALRVSEFTCRVEGGPLAGGIATGLSIWEADTTGAKLVSGNGVIRAGTSAVVYEVTQGSVRYQMTDGKVTGFTSSGTGGYKMATGAAAGLLGKTYSWTVSPNGPGQFIIDVTLD